MCRDKICPNKNDKQEILNFVKKNHKKNIDISLFMK